MTTALKNIFVLSLPRSGSSLLANLIHSAGYNLNITPDSTFLGSSEFNRDGYFEETRLTLFNDQLIRCVYGQNCSFLHLPEPPEMESLVKNSSIPQSFDYDIDESTLYIPDGFDSNIMSFTGNNWDNWGLSRMRAGGKWYKCYSKFKCNTGFQLQELLALYSTLFKADRGLVVKDPRMALVFHLYSVQKPKVILLRRNPEAVLESMRRHYGMNLFSNNLIAGSPFCSNHFNYKITPQTFDSYLESYGLMLERVKQQADYLEVAYEDILVSNDTIDRLESFIAAPINRALINVSANLS